MERKPVSEWTWDDWERWGQETSRIWETWRRDHAQDYAQNRHRPPWTSEED